MNPKYVPDRGHIVMVDFNPALGHEQKGRRPALILTVERYNKFGLCYALPITSKIKGFLTEVPLENTSIISGIILTNHLRVLDWKERNVEYIEKANEEILNEVNIRLRTLLEL